MSDKLFTPKKHVRYDKMGGVTDPCFHEGLIKLIDEFGYSGTSLLEEGIKAKLREHGLLKHYGAAEQPAAPSVVPVEVKVGCQHETVMIPRAATGGQ